MLIAMLKKSIRVEREWILDWGKLLCDEIC